MAAGLGFKDFTTGEVLTAADVDGYLMQGVWVFADAAARDAAVTSPQEGNFAYLKDTNVTTYYTGSAWANLDTTGMTNPMTTTGDIIYSSPGSTPVRLGIGSTGNVLTVAGGIPSWSAPAAGGGFTELASGTLATTGTTLSSINQGYKDLVLVLRDFFPSSGMSGVRIRLNGVTASSYLVSSAAPAGLASATNPGFFLDDINQGPQLSTQGSHANMRIFDYANTNARIITNTVFQYKRSGGTETIVNQVGTLLNSDNVDEINIAANSGDLSGTYVLYGVK